MISLIGKYKRKMLRLLKTPRAMRFREFEKMMNEYGFLLTHVKGSHHKFKNSRNRSITIPVHNKEVKKVYVKKIIKLLLFYL